MVKFLDGLRYFSGRIETKALVSGPVLNICTFFFEIFCLQTILFRTQNGLRNVESNRTNHHDVNSIKS